jgi:hypothetical protein
LLGYSDPDHYKLYEVHSGRIIYSRDVEFDERTPVAPLIEGGESSNTPVNDHPLLEPPELHKQLLDVSPLTSPLTPPESPKDSTTRIVPDPINPISATAADIPDLGYSLYGRRRQPSRRLLEAHGKVNFTSSSHLMILAPLRHSKKPLQVQMQLNGGHLF